MKWNRTNKYLSDARGRIPILRGLTVLTILLIMAIMLGGNGPPVFSETISDLFNADVLPSDSDVTPAEAVILEKTTLKEKHNPVIRRSRHVRANLDVLLQQGPMGLPLFNDVYLIVDKDRIDKRERGSYTVHGLVQGVDDSDVMIVVEQGMMVGHIRVDGTLYYVESIGSNLYTIQEWDESVFHSDMSPLIPDSEEMKEGEGLRIAFVDQEESPTNGTDTGELIDVMIVCTEDAVLGAGGLAKMNAIIQKAVEDTNQAYANSGIKPRIRLVHTAQIPYTETGNMKTDLERMTYHKDHKMDPIGIMDVVHTWRDSFGADLVSLIVEKGNGGLAWLTKPSATYASMGFSVLQREGLGMSQHKLARAFGHNMGAANNPKDANGRGAYAYSHGHRYQHPHDAKKNFRTIMAQPCKTGDVCNVKPYFSNPKKSLKGIPTGIVDQRDNVRTLNATAKVVANFRRSVDSKIRLSVEEPDSVSALSTFKGNYKRGGDKGFYVSTLTSQGTPTNTEELNVMNGPIDCDKKHGKDWVKKIVLQNATEAFKDKRDPWVIIDCHLTLEKTNVVTKRLIFKGGEPPPEDPSEDHEPSSSGVIVNCNGATLNGGRMLEPEKVWEWQAGDGAENSGRWHQVEKQKEDINYNSDMIEVSSSVYDTDPHPKKELLKWVRPKNITIKNCNIIGAVRVKGMSNADLKDPSRESEFTTIARNNAPTNIVFDSITITGLGRNPFYIGAGVTYSQLINSEIKGKSTAVGIYLDHESGWNTIKNNYIHVDTPNGGLFGTKVGKPQLAIDGSTHNKILNNTFSSLNNGGIELYRNCGERGVVRHQPPSHNQIINNIFYYNQYTGGSPAVYLGSRNANWLIDYCWEDEFERVWELDTEGVGGYTYTKIDSNQFGSSDSDLDYARHNVIMQNQFYKRKIFNSELELVNATPDDLIKTRNFSVNSPNYFGDEEGDPGENVMVTEKDAEEVGTNNWAKNLSWLREDGNPRFAGCYVPNAAKNIVLHGHGVESGSIHFHLWCNDGDLETFVPAPPKILTPMSGSIIPSGSVTFTGEHKGATHHWLWVGTTPGNFGIAKQSLGTSTSSTVTIPTSVKEKKVYLRYWSRINGTLVFTNQIYSVTNWGEATPQEPRVNNNDSEENPWQKGIIGGDKMLKK